MVQRLYKSEVWHFWDVLDWTPLGEKQCRLNMDECDVWEIRWLTPIKCEVWNFWNELGCNKRPVNILKTFWSRGYTNLNYDIFGMNWIGPLVGKTVPAKHGWMWCVGNSMVVFLTLIKLYWTQIVLYCIILYCIVLNPTKKQWRPKRASKKTSKQGESKMSLHDKREGNYFLSFQILPHSGLSFQSHFVGYKILFQKGARIGFHWPNIFRGCASYPLGGLQRPQTLQL